MCIFEKCIVIEKNVCFSFYVNIFLFDVFIIILRW